MSGVYIRGMEIPERCGKCRFATAFDCLVTKNFITTFDVRQVDCPLVPVADVRPVVRGKWIKHNATHVQKGGMYLECSCCHEYITVLGHVFDYCPNCGADMREQPKEKI